MRSGRFSKKSVVVIKYKMICFDVDGTLIDELTYIWTLIHESFGIDQHKVKSGAEKFYSGRMSFRKWAEHDVALWAGRGITKKDIVKVVKKLRIMPGARETLRTLKKRGYKLAVISGGLDIVLEYFFPEYEKLFSHVMINRLIFDGDGKVIGVEPTEFGADKYKMEGLMSIARKENISIAECVFIGDSDNDVDVAMGAGLGIGFMPHEKLAGVCDVVIRKKDMREILKHVE